MEGKEKSKKHKKHQKRSKSNDGHTSESNAESGATKSRIDLVSSSGRRDDVEIKQPLQTTSTLNTKFTEIMKSNGHVVVAKVPATKYNNGNSADASKRDSTIITTTTTTTNTIAAKIPTEPSKLVEFITKSLDPNTSTQVVSSASDSDTVRDVDSPDVAVIEEDDLNLDELMRQKALLQARLGGIQMSDTESENSHKTPVSTLPKIFVVDDKSMEKAKLKRIAEPVSDVILLDDSSNDAAADKPSPPKKKIRSSRSKSRERLHKERNSNNRNNRGDNRGDNRDNRDNNDKSSSKNRRSDVENRFKEDLRKEIDRDKERMRGNSPKPATQRQSSSMKPGTYSPNSKQKMSTTDKNRPQSSYREREVN